MKLINSLSDLFDVVINSVGNEWVYANRDAWAKCPEGCVFYVIPESEIDDMPDDEVYESEGGSCLPINLQHLDLWPWMEISNLQGVIENLRMMNREVFDVDMFIKGINYYRENDDFMEPA